MVRATSKDGPAWFNPGTHLPVFGCLTSRLSGGQTNCPIDQSTGNGFVTGFPESIFARHQGFATLSFLSTTRKCIDHRLCGATVRAALFTLGSITQNAGAPVRPVKISSLFFFLILIGCGGGSGGPTASAPQLPLVTDVYVAGAEFNSTVGVAKIWKNGVATSLTDGISHGTAGTIVVSGNDVYAGGQLMKGSGSIAAIWKNGTLIPLTDGSQSNCIVYSLFVSNGDVYAVGIEGYVTTRSITVAYIWKNGISSFLTTAPQTAGAHSVVVYGNDVYVGGYSDDVTIEGIFNIPYKAKIWKNGIQSSLTDGTRYASIKSIFINNNDIYAVGYENNNTNKMVAKIWKNGIPTPLTDGLYESVANHVCVSGNNVYVVGYESNGLKKIAKIWKNNISTSLSDGTQDGWANEVAVSGNDVYITGTVSNGTKTVAKIWKNGIETSLTDGTKNAFGNSIFLVIK